MSLRYVLIIYISYIRARLQNDVVSISRRDSRVPGMGYVRIRYCNVGRSCTGKIGFRVCSDRRIWSAQGNRAHIAVVICGTGMSWRGNVRGSLKIRCVPF